MLSGLVHEKLAHLFMDWAGTPEAEHRERAIEHFEEALEAYARAGSKDGCVRAHGNLGYLYAHRVRGVRVDNVRRAIDHLEAALRERTPADADWGSLHAALGALYADPSLK
jgi:TPR repeat protein